MSAVAANPNLLVNLKALLDDGLLTAEEFQQQKRKLLKSDAPATVAEPGEWKETMQELVKAQRDVASVLSSLAANPDLQGTDMGAFKRSREGSVWTTPDQPTLFTVGVKKVIGKKSNARGAVKVAGFHKCPQCSFVTSKPGPLARHMKTHIKHSGGNRSIASLFINAMSDEEQAKLSERQRIAARDVTISFIVSDIISSAVRDRKAPEWLRKQDGRATNRGAVKRHGRSFDFKKKVINDFERYEKLYSEHNAQISTLIADLYDISRQQVREYMRNKVAILQKAKCHATAKLSRIRKKKGSFHHEETVVYKLFQEHRKVGRQIGPKWIRQAMKREVLKIVADADATEMQKQAARIFRGKTSWLQRFAKRWHITLRRKTNVKKVPISERVPKLKRWMAIFRLHLMSHKDKVGYSKIHSIYPPRMRWSLDQVPAGLYDPKSTYENIGAQRVHIASNGSADSHRFCTLQMLLRNVKYPNLPRHGQPKLCMCFRGTGARIGEDETSQYRSDVIVMWQPKAWYDSATCNKWVAEYAMAEIDKTDCGAGERHLILCDNLGGQTRKTNPKWFKLLEDNCNCDVWNLLTGCTDEIQVVDAGFGALTKRKTEEVQQEWLQDDVHWEEWTGKNLSASRRRVLCTHWYGEGYQRACENYDFPSVFDRTGSNLTADGSNDNKIKLQGLDEFNFTLQDAQRDAISGEMPQAAAPVLLSEADARVEADDTAGQSDHEDAEEFSENDGSESEEGGETTDAEEGPDFCCPEDCTMAEETPVDDSGIVGRMVAHRFDVGWYIGKVQRKVTMSTNREENGQYAVKYQIHGKNFSMTCS